MGVQEFLSRHEHLHLLAVGAQKGGESLSNSRVIIDDVNQFVGWHCPPEVSSR